MTMKCFLLTLIMAARLLAADPFAEMVRKTEPLAPADQLKTFHLPPGFEIQLVAADPDIAKPMNLAFDSRGRLWVTETRLYPYPAKSPEAKKDCIKVIELGPDGRAAKITTFADNLDIPIGIYPITNGDRVIAFDINNVCLYTDADGDGKSDQREVLYSGWGYERDTHGMASNFRRGFDGWLYGCHGFNNISDVKDKSGGVMHLQSGNTYRMRLDGSRIEPFTIGQINPFGMSMDPLGNIYTSDSHSKPIYQLLRGGRYEAFDRSTDDGLGLAPMMMSHLHGSTAIAGSCFYAAANFPDEFRGNVFTGNVMTCRINRDRLEYHGSTPKAIEQPDFLTTDDPWFRPVQVVLGSDGALYIADFYNRIIGHYEVKLDHPGRDYQRGRIWKISFTAKDAKSAKGLDISKADVKELIEKLNEQNLTVRMFAMSELSDRIGTDAIEPLSALLESPTSSSSQKIHAAWVLMRLRALPVTAPRKLAQDADPSVRVHAMRIIAESQVPDSEMAIERLSDDDALVRRCAADALGQHPHPQHVRPLMTALAAADRDDTHLVHTLRMALRNQLRAQGTFANLAELSPDDVKTIADVALAVESPDAAEFLLNHIDQLAQDTQSLTRYLRHAVRFATSPNIEPLARIMREKFADDLDLQLDLFQSVSAGMKQRGQELDDPGRAWGTQLVTAALKTQMTDETWTGGPWDYEPRALSGGKKAMLLSSLPPGEQWTGVLRSAAFEVPSKLSFYLAGHNGAPDTNPPAKNVVRLRDAASGAVLAEALPPRSDVAQKISWGLTQHVGKSAYFEFTDGDAGTGFAWLAFGEIKPPVVPMPKLGPRKIQARLQKAAALAGEMQLAAARDDLIALLASTDADVESRAAAATALAKLRIEVPIIDAFKLAPAELQNALATALTSNTASAESLLNAVADGKIPARILLQSAIKDRLAAARVPDLDTRIKQLTRGVFAPTQQIEKELVSRRAAFRAAAQINPENGQKLFVKNCQPCHQIDGQGGQVGPQLAGMAKRGADRLIEDLLDPSRNVDPAFRSTHLILKDGSLVSGLQKSDAGEVFVIADQTGKELQVRKADVQQRIETKDSAMPSNFAEIIGPGDFNDLMAYLLSK